MHSLFSPAPPWVWLLRRELPARPRVIGIAQITVRAHDLKRFAPFLQRPALGFDEAIDVLKDRTVSSKTGLAQSEVIEVFFKVNIRQYIVVAPETSPEQPRLASYAIETDDAEAMRVWIKSLGYKTPDAVRKTASGNIAFEVDDPEGLTIRILQYTPESVSVRNVGKFLSPNRLTTRIIHTGYTVTRPETVKFYQDAFTVREFCGGRIRRCSLRAGVRRLGRRRRFRCWQVFRI